MPYLTILSSASDVEQDYSITKKISFSTVRYINIPYLIVISLTYIAINMDI